MIRRRHASSSSPTNECRDSGQECVLSSIEIGEGWQYLTLDLSICANAWHPLCQLHRVHRERKLPPFQLFFQKNEYADVELPEFLRVCVEED